MKVTLNWLKQYVDFDWSPDELSERLTMLGLEVEGVEKRGGEFDGIVVAQVITKDKHPNADKLSLCRVNDGQGERQIVCGAQNFKAGDKVPLILPGASLPPKPGEKEPFTIKVGKIRGVESHGMMCAPQELGLSDEVDGLLILSPEAKVGQPFAEYLGRTGSDVVYDLEVTPNRPDLNSVIGIAREIAAVTGNPLKIPGVEVTEAGESAADAVAVRIDDAELCPRYTARVIKGVKIGPSPAWLREALEKVGIRSISNVVDVTNYVMLESGQPLHAFDYHLIGKGADGKPTVVIRRATDGEKFTTLDGNEHELDREALLIADEQKGIALAGVMGGLNTEINDQTVDVLLESAYFAPTNVRRTSKKLGQRTDASYRFERGADIGVCDWASQRAAQLILQTAGGQLLSGLVDAWPTPPKEKTISLRFERTNSLLGIEVPGEDQVGFLAKLELKRVGDDSGDNATFSVPTWRVDLKREADLIEEIARLYGVDRIPATPPRGALGTNAFDGVFDQHSDVRRILTSLGLDEAQGQTLIADSAAGQSTASDVVVRLANPLSSDMNVLRPSLLPGLLEMLRHNAHRKEHDVALFEIGRVFLKRQGKLVEERRLAIAMTGARQPGFWSGNRELVDVSDLKGIVEELTERLGLRGLAFQRRGEPTHLFVESAEIKLGGKLWIGEMGQLSPLIGKQLDLKGAVFLAEFDLDQVLARRGTTGNFKSLPAFPSISRDVAMIVPETVTHEQVLQTVKRSKAEFLEGVELFDVFRGKNIAEGSKSLAYAFTYRHGERTLKDDEANASHARVVNALREQLSATIRDQ
ncbi:phenylalanine--tRNA ligase subunit beta [bacterium]|nr:phenylalanine--tRNA ligase subunit beta [bacterium]